MEISEFINLSQFMDTKSNNIQRSAEVFMLKSGPQTMMVLELLRQNE